MRGFLVFLLVSLGPASLSAQPGEVSRLHLGMFIDGYLGEAVLALNDIDGDQKPDYAIAVPGADQVVIHSGHDGAVIRTHEGSQAGEEFGFSVANAGDVNADGICDIVVGAWKYDRGQFCNVGRVYLFNGADGLQLWTREGEFEADEFGTSVAGGADVDGDGFSDAIIGAPGHSPGALSIAGKIYVHSGATGALIYTQAGEENNQKFGTAVAMPGDLNGDGYSEFVAGSEFRESKREIVWYSGVDGVPLQTSDNRTNRLRMVTSGDLNSDGVADLIVTRGSFWGGLRALSGATGTALYDLSGLVPSYFPRSLTALSDWDGDGVADIAVGTRNGVKVLGGAFGNTLWEWEAASHYPGGRFGTSIAEVGEGGCGGSKALLIGAGSFDTDPGANNGAAVIVELPPFTETHYRRGDSNGDGAISLGDVIVGLQFLFAGQPASCVAALDVDDDGSLGLRDPVFQLNFLFVTGAPSIPPPFPECGADPTPSSLCCVSGPVCP